MNPSSPIRRAAAFAIDWLLIAGWAGLLFLVTLAAQGGQLSSASGPWMGQAVGFVALTLPTVLYFTWCESSRRGATVGKLAVGLVVTDLGGGRIGFARALSRNALKLAPWELGHTVAQQAVFSGPGAPPAWLAALAALALAGPVWWVASIAAGGDAPYDRWAGTRVSARTRR